MSPRAVRIPPEIFQIFLVQNSCAKMVAGKKSDTVAMFGKSAREKPQNESLPKLLSYRTIGPDDVYSPLYQQTTKNLTLPKQTNGHAMHTPWRTEGKTLMKKTFSLASLFHVNRYQISKPTPNISSSSTSSSTFSSLKKLLQKPLARGSRLKSAKSEMDIRRFVFLNFELLLLNLYAQLFRKWTEMGFGDVPMNEIDRFSFFAKLQRIQVKNDLFQV